ncbi:MAG: DUF885 domain-containing protein [Planctomycetes bacterium]|nr:DUF885 domain-containing protein [Planctomycetota bacterium]
MRTLFLGAILMLPLGAHAFADPEPPAAGAGPGPAAATAAAPAPSPADAAQALARLAEEYWEEQMSSSPTWATYIGDHRYNDRLEEIGPAARARYTKVLDAFQARLAPIAAAQLGEADRILADLLARKFAMGIEEPRHKFYQWGIDQMYGPQVRLFELVNYHPMKTEKDLADYAARLEAFPRYFRQYVGDLREGLGEGRTATRVVCRRVLEQLDAQLAMPPEQCALHEAVDRIPAGWSTRATIAARVEAAIRGPVYDALRSFRDFVKDEELPKAREEDGLWSLPGGDEAYRFRIRDHTTLDRSAEELHKIGLEELEAIQAEMLAIARRRGHTGDLNSFFEGLRKDPKNFSATREELLDGFRAILAKATAKLPRYFLKLPSIPCEVKAMEAYREKDSVAAFYYGPPDDGSRPGIFYANTYDLPARPRYNMTALTVHEAVPGHHLQIALALEQRSLPKVRRHEGFTAYVEGWALYSERLADEMGLYEDELSRVGMLTYQAWRATRLVVDTGLHAFKWPRQRAIDFMKSNLALGDTEVVNEVDRYIIWPGQALAYKVGQREILALRAEAQAKLGPRFDLREFHDVVLRNGAVPLPTLRGLVARWIEERAGTAGGK